MKNLLLVACLLVAACSGSTADVDYVEPDSYHFTVTYTAFSPSNGTWIVFVRDGEVTDVLATSPEQQWDIDNGWVTPESMWTLAEIVERYEEASSLSRATASITYADGHPHEVRIDWSDAYDDEDSWLITDVVVTTD